LGDGEKVNRDEVQNPNIQMMKYLDEVPLRRSQDWPN
jgi:hypothetical protein